MGDQIVIKLHFEGQVAEITNVDADTYSYVVLLSDMTEKFYNDSVLWQRLNIKVACSVVGGKERIVVDDDKKLLEVFKLHGGKKTIDFYFTLIDGLGKDSGVAAAVIGKDCTVGLRKDSPDGLVKDAGVPFSCSSGFRISDLGIRAGLGTDNGAALIRNIGASYRGGYGFFSSSLGTSTGKGSGPGSSIDMSTYSLGASGARDEVHEKWGSGLVIDGSALALNPFLQNGPLPKKQRKKRINHVPKPDNHRRSTRISECEEGSSGAKSITDEAIEVEVSGSSDDELYVISDSDDDVNLSDDYTSLFSNHNVDESEGESDGGLSHCSDSEGGKGKDLDESDSDIDDDPMKGLLNRDCFKIPNGQQWKLEQGMIFENIDAYRKVLYEYSIQWGFTLNKIKNERTRVTAICNQEGCGWRAHASLMPDGVTFCIKTCNPNHTCMVDPELQASAKWISQKIEGLVRADRNVSIHVIRESLQSYGINPSDLQLFRARHLATQRIDGSHAMSYTLMPKYCRMVQLNNKQNIAKIQYQISAGETIPYIKKVFVGFAEFKNGFMAGCAPFIGFDGCHLKGPYGGVLLSAVGLDGNNGLVPIANAVVEAETRDSWSFFLTLLSDLMDGFPEGYEWTFMSDRQKGLTEALLDKIPHCRHRKCCHHIEANFKADFPGVSLRKLFWAAAKAYTKEEFNQIMQQIKQIDEAAYKWLEKIEVRTWARHAFSETLKCDHITNNLSESFNSWIGKFRNKPILTIFENIRRTLMAKSQKRFAKACLWTYAFTPRVINALRKAAHDCRPLTYWKSQGETFEVRDADRSYVVRLDKRHCDCRVWNHTWIPCKHATVVVLGQRRKLLDYCNPILSKEKYLAVYSHVADPIPDQFFWPEMQQTICKPPLLRRRVGRPTSTRRRAIGEGPASMKRSFIIRCSKCGTSGHNARSCAGGPVRIRNKKKKAKNAVGSDANLGVIAPTQSSQTRSPVVVPSDTVVTVGAAQSSQPRKKTKTSNMVQSDVQVSAQRATCRSMPTESIP